MQRPAAPGVSTLRMPIGMPQTVSPPPDPYDVLFLEQLQQPAPARPRGLAVLMASRVRLPQIPNPTQPAAVFRMPLPPVSHHVANPLLIPPGCRMPPPPILPRAPAPTTPAIAMNHSAVPPPQHQLAGIRMPPAAVAQLQNVGVRVSAPLALHPQPVPILRRHTPPDPNPHAPQQPAPETLSAATFTNNSLLGQGGFGQVIVKLVNNAWIARKRGDNNRSIEPEVRVYKLLQEGHQLCPYLVHMIVCLIFIKLDYCKRIYI